MKSKSKFDLIVIVLSVIPFVGWLSLVLNSLSNFPNDLVLTLGAFATLFILLVIFTSWPSRKSAYIAVALALLALIPLYIESQSPYGQYTQMLFLPLALIFVLYYLFVNYLKLRRLKNN